MSNERVYNALYETYVSQRDYGHWSNALEMIPILIDRAKKLHKDAPDGTTKMRYTADIKNLKAQKKSIISFLFLDGNRGH